MAGFKMEIKAGPMLLKKLEALRKEKAGLNAAVSSVVRDSTFSIVAKDKNTVPQSTGALMRSRMAVFLANGWIGMVGSWLPYAFKQETDESLDHSVRPPRRRVLNTKSGKRGSIIKGTKQTNPNAKAWSLRDALLSEKEIFIGNLQQIVRAFGKAWTAT